MAGHVVDANNRLLSDGVFNYTYDAEGNRISREHIVNQDTVEYEWDYRNRLVKVTFKDDLGAPTKVVFQIYDSFNRWIGQEVDTDGDTDIDEVKFFAYEGNQIALEFDGTADADLANRYLWGAAVDQILADEEVGALNSPGHMLWPLTDHLNTVRDLAEYADGPDTTAVVNHIEYNSFGLVTNETDPGVDHRFGFTARPFDDETLLQNNLNRWYDAVVGQWASEDPIGFSADDSNLRRYVGNDAIRFVDPTGLIRPSEFWEKWSEEKREKWFEDFRDKYGEYILASAKRYCVPAELLAAVIANEMIDYTDAEAMGERFGVGSSLGPAQIHIRLAKQYNLVPSAITMAHLRGRVSWPFPKNPDLKGWTNQQIDWLIKYVLHGTYDADIRWYLNRADLNIDAAAKLMRIFLDDLHARANPIGPWGNDPPAFGNLRKDFVRKIIGVFFDSANGKRFRDEVASANGKDCGAVIQMDVSIGLMRAMQAMFNDSLDVLGPGGVNQNVIDHVTNMESLDDRLLMEKLKPRQK